MDDVPSYMAGEHRECDELFAEAESAVHAGDWQSAERQFSAYDALTRLHLRREEEVLFPAFEAATGMTDGPTEMMRREHRQMRALLEVAAEAVEQKDAEAFLGHADTLMILTQQHNMKEEQVLYPMSNSSLAGEVPAVLERMREMS